MGCERQCHEHLDSETDMDAEGRLLEVKKVDINTEYYFNLDFNLKYRYRLVSSPLKWSILASSSKQVLSRDGSDWENKMTAESAWKRSGK